MDDTEEYEFSSDASEDVPGKKDFRQLRRRFLDNLHVQLAAIREHVDILRGAHVEVAEGAATQDEMAVLVALDVGVSTFIKTRTSHETNVILERRLLRKSSVVFEVRTGSKARAWSRKMSRGTHKRLLWLINEELLVTKVNPGDPPYAHRELCREFIRQMKMEDVSVGPHQLLQLKFLSGFVFTAHFESRSELKEWMRLLQPTAEDVFPWGVPFEDQDDSVLRPPVKEALFKPYDDMQLHSLLEKVARLEGLAAAQLAALSSTGGDSSSSRNTKKRQMRMQRAMYGVLQEMQTLSLQSSRHLFGQGRVVPSPMAQAQDFVAKATAGLDEDSWSESDDSSATDEDLADRIPSSPVPPRPVLGPVPVPPASPLPQREAVPPMPSVSPRRPNSLHVSSETDNEVLFAVRRQLALKDAELAKVRNQLSNVVNENWRKNLQVAQLKKQMGLDGDGVELRSSSSLPSSSETPLSSIPSSRDNSFQDVRKFVRAAPLHTIPTQFAGLLTMLWRRVLVKVSLADLSSLMQTCKAAYGWIRLDEGIWRHHLLSLSVNIPPAVFQSSSSSKDRLWVLLQRFLCAGACGQLCGGVISRLGVPHCGGPACLAKLVVTVDEAQEQYALSADDLKRLPSAAEPGKNPVYARNLVQRASYAKYAGPAGLQIRLRALSKQRQLIALSRFKPVSTRPDLDEVNVQFL